MRTKLRFLFAIMWLFNMVFQFGLLFAVLPKIDGQLSLRWLAVVGLLFIFCIYLLNDILRFKRVLFLRIVAVAFFISSAIYLFNIIYIFNIYSLFYFVLLIPTLLSGLVILKKTNNL